MPSFFTWNLNIVTRHNFASSDSLNTILVASNDFSHLGFIFFQGFDGTFCVSFLKPKSSHTSWKSFFYQNHNNRRHKLHTDRTCHTPMMAFAIRMSKITKGSTNAVTPSVVSSCSSNKARTCTQQITQCHHPRLIKVIHKIAHVHFI